MCGIAGIVDFNKKCKPEDVYKMIQPLSHRGPDDEGILLRNFDNSTIGFGQKRLSIIDLSQGGHQPKTFKHLDLVLNGEIYNFLEIRQELSELGYQFDSNSDTEVVLKAFDQWGILCVDRFIGMFAFCIMDNRTQKMYLCRDRLGVKPLFYYYHEGLFLFASELKALKSHALFCPEIDKGSVRTFLQFGYIPAPFSIFQNTYKLVQGSWGILDCSNGDFGVQKYWNIQEKFEKPTWDLSYEEARNECEKLIISACKYRMVADVPVGVFLSGGYDSTLITSLLVNNGFDTLRTYTIGFPDGKDESKDAENIAGHLGTKHTSFNCTMEEAKSIIPQLPYYYDEPCADISCIPTMMVSRLAGKDVKVALSADGGDELFAGYNGYYQTIHRLKIINSIPSFINPVVGFISNFIHKFLPISISHKLKGWSNYSTSGNNISQFILDSSKIPDAIIDKILLNKNSLPSKIIKNLDDLGNNILLSGFETTLPDYLLVKVDRASMSASIEAREPLLDHRLVEFTARLPFEFKNDGQTSKRIIKEIVHKYVPKEIMDRPKTGFDLPIFDWLKKDLSFFIDDYLNEDAIKKTKLFSFKEVNLLIQDFKQNKLKYQNIIWNLISFQMWYEMWILNETKR